MESNPWLLLVCFPPSNKTIHICFEFWLKCSGYLALSLGWVCGGKNQELQEFGVTCWSSWLEEVKNGGNKISAFSACESARKGKRKKSWLGTVLPAVRGSSGRCQRSVTASLPPRREDCSSQQALGSPVIATGGCYLEN